MKLILLNWSGGENDPFTAFNEGLKLRLHEFGVHSQIIEIGDGLSLRLKTLMTSEKFTGVLTHQGLASHLREPRTNEVIWENLRLPLVCLHGDHPALFPPNHSVDSKYVTHAYSNPHFARYANQMRARVNPAVHLYVPSFFKHQERFLPILGDYFVFPKNLDPVKQKLELWKQNMSEFCFARFQETSMAIMENYHLGNSMEHHEIIDLFFSSDVIARLMQEFQLHESETIRNFVHAELDKIYRNNASELVLEELKDIPLRVFGRGWEGIENKSARHSFGGFDRVVNGDAQFLSKYGIVDVSSNKCSVHDRMLRAVALGGGFLSNSSAGQFGFASANYEGLFFSGRPGELREKAESILQHPKEHIEKSREFGSEFYRNESFESFLSFLSERFSV